MPIVFQAPEPYSQQISQGAGAAQQFDTTLPTISSLYAAAGRNRAAHAGDAFQQAAAAQAQQASQNFLGEQHAGQQASQMDLLRAGQAGQYGLQQQHAENQAWLSQQQLSQAENLRLQRMQNAAGDISNAINNGTMTAEEGNQALVQLRTGIDPLRQRQQRQQMEAQQLQIRNMQEQMGHQDAIWDQQQRYRARTLQEHLEPLVDENTGLEVQMFRDQNGSPHPVFGGEGGGGGAGGAGTRNRRSQSGGGGGEGEFEGDFTHSDLMDRAERLAQEYDDLGKKKPLDRAKVMEHYRALARDLRRAPGVNRAQVYQAIWDELRQNFPQAPAAERRRWAQQALPGRLAQAQQALEANAPGTLGGTSDSSGGLAGGAATAVPGQPEGGQGSVSNDPIQARANQINQAASRRRANDTPFQWSEPSTQTQPQREAVTSLNRIGELWSAQHIPERLRREAAESVTVMQDLLSRRGSEAAMTPHEQTVYRRHRDLLAREIPGQRRERTIGEHISRGWGLITRPRNVFADLEAGRNPNE